MRTRMLSVLFLFALAGGLFAQAPVVDGKSQPAGRVERDLWYEAVGTVQPRMTTTLSSKVMGNVLEVLKREGDRVKQGDILVRVDAKDISSDLAGARAGLSEAAASLSELDKNRMSALAQKDQVQANLKLAESSYLRVKELFDKKSVSRQEFDQAEAQVESARAQLKSVEAQIGAVDAAKSRVGARMNQAQAGVSKVQTIRELAEVMAPFDGRITARKVEPGMLAAPGVPLMVLEDDTNPRFEAVVPEGLIASVTEGTELSVSIDSLAGVVLPGKVVEIAPSGDPMTHTFIVKIGLAAHPRLRSGMYGRGNFVIGRERVLVVPPSAVEERGQLEGVFVKGSGGNTVFRLIRTGRRLPEGVEILSGLTEGEDVLEVVPAKGSDGR